MSALNDIVRSGKARYIGACNFIAWQIQKANYIAEKNGWVKFVSAQNYLNLLYREEERELLPFCKEEKIGVIPWSPIARGKLTRDWEESTNRSETDGFGKYLHSKMINEGDKNVVEAVKQIAENRGVSRAQIATAWVLQKDTVSAPIIGATKEFHLTDAVASIGIKLSIEEISLLEKYYVPHESFSALRK